MHSDPISLEEFLGYGQLQTGSSAGAPDRRERIAVILSDSFAVPTGKSSGRMMFSRISLLVLRECRNEPTDSRVKELVG